MNNVMLMNNETLKQKILTGHNGIDLSNQNINVLKALKEMMMVVRS